MKKRKKTQPSLKAMAGKRRIFLDYAAITPIDPKVKKEMEKVQKKFWANPSSLHTEGEEAKNVLEEARVNIARILHCRAGEIFFTSGGTESLNMAILGVVKSAKPRSDLKLPRSQRSDLGFALPHIITSTIEHPAVLEPIKFLLKNKEAEVSFIAPNEKGIINPESIKKEIKENTVLVVIQHANNEIGTIQPVSKISRIIKTTRMPLVAHPYFLVDASQSVLYEDVSLERLGADLLVLDGIKIYGPRGAGILAVKHGVNISPIIFGGGQEGGLRSGTENVANAAGLAKALELARRRGEKESLRLTRLRNYTIAKILEEIRNSSLNGDLENRLPNNINICFKKSQSRTLNCPGPKSPTLTFDSEFLVIKLDTLGFAVSAASACHTLSSNGGSYVIESIGKPECASSSLRFTLGRDSKKIHLDKLIVALKNILC